MINPTLKGGEADSARISYFGGPNIDLWATKLWQNLHPLSKVDKIGSHKLRGTQLNRIDNQLRKTINLNRQLLDVKCYSISRIGSDLCWWTLSIEKVHHNVTLLRWTFSLQNVHHNVILLWWTFSLQNIHHNVTLLWWTFYLQNVH